MTNRRLWDWIPALLIGLGTVSGGSSRAGSGHSAHGHSHGHPHPSAGLPASGGIGWPYWYNSGSIVSAPPFIIFQPFWPVYVPVPARDPTPLAGPMPAAPRPAVVPVKTAKADVQRSGSHITIGDRLFRAGNTKKSAERYHRAALVDPTSATPQIRLAQVALVRGQYAEAADRLRQAVSLDPGWIAKAPDVQSLYAEPGDFRRLLAKLESHLLLEPTDRDGWLVLGAELFLSGQTRRAGDVFLRLTDRKPDATLSAFLDAATPRDVLAH